MTNRTKILILLLSLLVVAGGVAAFFIFEAERPLPVPTLTPSPAVTPSASPTPASTLLSDVWIGNFHTHTLDSDGKMSYREAIDEATRLGFNFIAITDHNKISKDVADYCSKESKILCIVGEEVSSKEGHILAIDIKEAIPKDLSAEETVEKIHQQGGLAIPSHPNYSNGLTTSQIEKLPFDAVECSFRHKESGGDKFGCDSLSGFPKVYNSDAHQKENLAIGGNKCQMPYLNIQNLKTAVKSGNCFEFDF